jgi:Mor family transcriptional regulator
MEMLYDTPLPETLQTDRMAEKADRNAESTARYRAGETGANIAQAFDISEQRVYQIVRRQRS